jgi:hypothetical protein
VTAVLVRGRDEGDPEYRDLAQCERWEVIVPELVFEPADPEEDPGGGGDARRAGPQPGTE